MDWIRLMKNIPLRFNEERSEQLAYKYHKDAYRWIYVSSGLGFCCPAHWLVVGLWRFHAFNRGGRAEILDFLRLAEGCSNLLDLGASAGIFSALFARSRDSAQIVSVEPDPLSYSLLAETRHVNQQPDGTWRTERIVVGESIRTVKFCATGFGGNVVAGSGEGEEIAMETLPALCGRLDFKPDLIKVDVESFEDESLLGCLRWLQEMRPRIFLELHWKMLIERGKCPETMLQQLSSIGLTMVAGDLLTITERDLDGGGCVRLALRWNDN